jgi:hypothetical protein
MPETLDEVRVHRRSAAERVDADGPCLVAIDDPPRSDDDLPEAAQLLFEGIS